jgi:hypothetical protein
MAKAPLAKMDRATARAEGPLLMTKGTRAIDQFLTSLNTPRPLLGPTTARALPVAGGDLMAALLAR